MAERLFGTETEYAIAVVPPRPDLERPELLQQIMETAHQKLTALPDICSAGLFLQNGARFYVDCGLHPEISTPECANPWDAVRYSQAADRILGELAQAVQSKCLRDAEVLCFRSNVDYSGTAATWGCHESYMYSMRPHDLSTQMIPHLVTRIIYTGAGGFNPLSPGIEFTLSPRVAHLEHVISDESTNNRGIFHTRNEPLCEGYNRLHVLCGESLCSETAAFLKVGATALVVALADAGLNPGNEVLLAAPLQAMRAVAEDETCRQPLAMANGGAETAIEIQRHYLRLAEQHAAADFMPPWAGEVCSRWRAILDALEDAPRAVAQTLDWAIKLPLYMRHTTRRIARPDLLPVWLQVAGRLKSALEASRWAPQAAQVEVALGAENPVPEAVAKLAAVLQSRGSGWVEFKKYLELRRQLFELDTRFAQLGGQGIFQRLDSAGVLSHRVRGVDNIEHAVANPPATGRAAIRGQVIKRVAGSGPWACDWQSIFNQDTGALLDLSNPFEAQEVWTTADTNDAMPLGRHLFPRSGTSFARALANLRRRA